MSTLAVEGRHAYVRLVALRLERAYSGERLTTIFTLANVTQTKARAAYANIVAVCTLVAATAPRTITNVLLCALAVDAREPDGANTTSFHLAHATLCTCTTYIHVYMYIYIYICTHMYIYMNMPQNICTCSFVTVERAI